jgi:hypothetical protein
MRLPEAEDPLRSKDSRVNVNWRTCTDGNLIWSCRSFSLLLLLALFLFSAALSIYLRTVHHTLAVIVLALSRLPISEFACCLAALGDPTLAQKDNHWCMPMTLVARAIILSLHSTETDPALLQGECFG